MVILRNSSSLTNFGHRVRNIKDKIEMNLNKDNSPCVRVTITASQSEVLKTLSLSTLYRRFAQMKFRGMIPSETSFDDFKKEINYSGGDI